MAARGSDSGGGAPTHKRRTRQSRPRCGGACKHRATQSQPAGERNPAGSRCVPEPSQPYGTRAARNLQVAARFVSACARAPPPHRPASNPRQPVKDSHLSCSVLTTHHFSHSVRSFFAGRPAPRDRSARCGGPRAQHGWLDAGQRGTREAYAGDASSRVSWLGMRAWCPVLPWLWLGVATAQQGRPTVCPYPVTYQMNRSTIIMPCNESGLTDPQSTKGWGIVLFDHGLTSSSNRAAAASLWESKMAAMHHECPRPRHSCSATTAITAGALERSPPAPPHARGLRYSPSSSRPLLIPPPRPARFVRESRFARKFGAARGLSVGLMVAR